MNAHQEAAIAAVNHFSPAMLNTAQFAANPSVNGISLVRIENGCIWGNLNPDGTVSINPACINDDADRALFAYRLQVAYALGNQMEQELG